MKKLIFLALLSMSIMHAQDSKKLDSNSIAVGDMITIGSPSGKSYQHILFPKTNFIIKKGGTTNFKKLKGLQAVITEREEKKSKTIVTIKRKDGKKFLNSLNSIKVDLKKAIEAKEIL
ncbi:hypothetical protein [Aquimarina litoralis]|uniref:hypothetical protein n=1 Tax=Aquimarina litoralis TaxID=584605 RepID=UPI001C560E3D|nr:hypothetical protein [Aquimarina litoralis]MBW1298032.1 hypothetical protein [Aquimarina litoralis]